MRLLCFEARRRRRRCRVAWLGWESKRSDFKEGFLLFVLPPSRCIWVVEGMAAKVGGNRKDGQKYGARDWRG